MNRTVDSMNFTAFGRVNCKHRASVVLGQNQAEMSEIWNRNALVCVRTSKVGEENLQYIYTSDRK